ncbi:transposase, partial [Bacillus mycoides]|uniref:transposase n=1 Tax=Bacillus mycoides TaxID=1405 RepID=UPI003D19C758
WRVVTKTGRELLRADKPIFIHFIYVQNRRSTLYFHFALNKWVPMKQVHELYSLRWQIEIVFKTWKSLFDIDHCRTVKQERIECHLYGKLIAIFLCSSTMFKMRQLLLQKKQKELSEYKAFGMIQDHLFLLYQAIDNTQEITKVLIRLFTLLQKNGRKSHRYEKKTVFDIMGVIYEYSGCSKQKKAA